MEPEQPRHTQLAIGAALAIFLLVLVRTAWVAEDAFINFRTIDNFLHGYGLRWNVAERVQTFTDPLWVLIVAEGSAVTGEFYDTTLVLSFAFTIAALLVYVRGAGSGYAAAAGIVLLTTSKAFVDFSTSGLEGPLVHSCSRRFSSSTGSGRRVRERWASWRSSRPAAQSRASTRSCSRRP